MSASLYRAPRSRCTPSRFRPSPAVNWVSSGNAVVVVIAGKVVAHAQAQLSVAPGVELGAQGQPLGVVFVTEGILSGQVQLGGHDVVFAAVGDTGGNHGFEFEGVGVLQQRFAAGGIQFHGNQVPDHQAEVPLM